QIAKVDANGLVHMSVDSFTPGGTQTVAGTVTANQGTPAAQANAWPVFLSDNTGHLQFGTLTPGFGAGSALVVISALGDKNGNFLGNIKLSDLNSLNSLTAVPAPYARGIVGVVANGGTVLGASGAGTQNMIMAVSSTGAGAAD